jgi:hypothetical protein
MDEVKTLEEAKKRIRYLEDCIRWLSDGDFQTVISNYESFLFEVDYE